VFLDIHSLILVISILDLIMPMFGATCIILLTMILIRALITLAMLSLTLHHPGTIVMLF